jgi:hypothetical protein
VQSRGRIPDNSASRKLAGLYIRSIVKFKNLVTTISQLMTTIEPCGIDFLTSVGIGIGFRSNVGFRSGSVSVLGLKKVVGFFRFFE